MYTLYQLRRCALALSVVPLTRAASQMRSPFLCVIDQNIPNYILNECERPTNHFRWMLEFNPNIFGFLILESFHPYQYYTTLDEVLGVMFSIVSVSSHGGRVGHVTLVCNAVHRDVPPLPTQGTPFGHMPILVQTCLLYSDG